MKMNDFVHTLQSKLAAAKPDFRDDDSVLGFLCSAYYDQNCTDDSEEIKDAFEALYEAMKRVCLMTKDEREEMGKCGREHVERNFDRRDVVKKTVEVMK